MARLILVRHGRAAASWGEDPDPGLDELGRAQAAAAAEALAPIGPLPIVASPLRRTRETAAAFESRWGMKARIEPAVGEIPSPTSDLSARTEWLRSVMASTWDAQSAELHQWRDGLLRALLDLQEDTLVVTHFVAINVAVGAATDDPRVISFHADYCSRNVFDSDGRRLTLVDSGGQAETVVL